MTNLQDHAGLDHFLADDSLPAAIFHSEALNRTFIMARDEAARDEAALDALLEEDEGLPVLFFSDCAHTLGLKGLEALLNVRETFGPFVRLRSVKGGVVH